MTMPSQITGVHTVGVASAVTPAPRARAAAARRVIGCRNSPYEGYNDTRSQALGKLLQLRRGAGLGGAGLGWLGSHAGGRVGVAPGFAGRPTGWREVTRSDGAGDRRGGGGRPGGPGPRRRGAR